MIKLYIFAFDNEYVMKVYNPRIAESMILRKLAGEGARICAQKPLFARQTPKVQAYSKSSLLLKSSAQNSFGGSVGTSPLSVVSCLFLGDFLNEPDKLYLYISVNCVMFAIINF